MAKQVVGPNSRVTWNATDISQYVTSIDVEDSKDEVEVTGFGETYREYTPGLGDGSAQLTVLDDQAAGGPDATMYPNYANSTAGTLKWTPNTAGTIVYTLVGKIYSWPTGGGVGDPLTRDVAIRNAGTAGVTRGTA